MLETIITDKDNFKLRVDLKNCSAPEGLKHIRFTGEDYNNDGELVMSRTYEFFLNHSDLQKLATTLQTDQGK